MTTKNDSAGSFTFADAERAQRRDWVRLDASAKVGFFDEMVELVHRSGALRQERRDAPPTPRSDGSR